MNTDKLKEILAQISAAEQETNTQKYLQDLLSGLNELVNQPQNPDLQTRLVERLRQLNQALERFYDTFSPQDYRRLLEMSEIAFSKSIPEDVRALIEENPISPNVVAQYVQQLHSDRGLVFNNTTQLLQNLEFLQFGFEKVEEDSAELGFQIPRELFEDRYDGFIKELNEIRRMVRIVSEAAVGDYQPPRVGSISTTDPLIFLEVAIPVAKVFGAAVTWGIGVWYSVEQIRKVRAQTAQISAFTEAEIKKIFDTKIQEQIDTSVDEKIASMLENNRLHKTRRPELEVQLKWVLESLLAKMERGFTVELRLPPPPEELEDRDESGEHSDSEAQNHNDLVEIQKQLVFPSPNANPVLEIPKLDGDGDD